MSSVALAPFEPLKGALKYAFMPFIFDVWIQIRDRLQLKSTETKWRLSSFIELRRTFFVHLWRVFGSGSDQHIKEYKEQLLAPAKGVVLDLGAGFGHSLNYLSRDKISRYIAVEPNARMHSELRDAAHKAGYLESDGSFVLLSCSAEDVTRMIADSSTADTRTPHSMKPVHVDSIICFLVLCSVANAERTVTQLVREVLRPGGTLFMFEHVRHPRTDVAWWQWVWSPLWSVFFDGCRLDCTTDKWVQEMIDVESPEGEIGMWKEIALESDTGNGWENNIIHHVIGTFIKHD